ncbi:arsenate reductase ArsC [Gammaproteobacteria bacterium]|nr:arsenate reductase ArsC [Gammaproteobacteria bacterium]
MNKKILFVCVENSCRSQMAEGLARMVIAEKGMCGVEVYSAGSRPSGHVNSKAIVAMAELGYDLSVHDSKSLDEIPDEQFAVVITMGCGDECPWVRGDIREDWALPDPKHMSEAEFNQVRDEISTKVNDLLTVTCHI